MNKLSLKSRRQWRERKGSDIISSNFDRRSVASTLPGGLIFEGNLDSTKIQERDEFASWMTEDATQYYTALEGSEGDHVFPSSSSSTSDDDEILHLRNLLFSGKKNRKNQKKVQNPLLLASDSDNEDSGNRNQRTKNIPLIGRRSSILGNHEVVLITSESDDEDDEVEKSIRIPRSPVNDRVEDWLMSTSPIPASPATPARILLSSSSSSSSRENSDDEDYQKERISDVQIEDSEATSKACFEILKPLMGNLSLGDTTSKGGCTMETIREEDEEVSLDIEIISIDAEKIQKKSMGVQTELNFSSSESEKEENESRTSGPSRVSVAVQAELDDNISDEELESISRKKPVKPLSYSSAEEGESGNESEDTSEDVQAKKLDHISTPQENDSCGEFNAYLSSIRKKYNFFEDDEKKKEETNDWREQNKDIISNDSGGDSSDSKLVLSDDNENEEENEKKEESFQEKEAPSRPQTPLAIPSVLKKIPEIINLSSDEETSSPLLQTKPLLIKGNNKKVQKKDNVGKGYASFLSSLSQNVDDDIRHPDAIKYVNQFTRYKIDLTNRLYKLFNEEAFEGLLPPNMEIEWNPRLRKTAGICTQKRKYIGTKTLERSSKIGLSSKVLDSGDRLRDTLIHEMCHAAAWVLSGYRDGHGPVWKSWARKAMNRFPELPIIDRCHNYQIRTKYTYRCEKCGYSIGRHSKSLDIDKKCCGYCRGRFVLLTNYKNGPSGMPQTTPSRTPNAFASFVKEHYKDYKKSGVNHAEVMKILGAKFKANKG